MCGKIDVSSSSFRLTLHPSIHPLLLSPRPHALPFFSVVFGEDFAMTQREREREMLVVMGRGVVRGTAEAYNLLFTPNLAPPQHSLSPLSCTPPFSFLLLFAPWDEF